MPAEHIRPDVGRFSSVDTAAEPGALIAWLDTSKALPAIGAAKSTLLDQLELGRARSVLDVGCGFGADVADMARRMPPGGTATGIDASATMIAEARYRTRDLGHAIRFDTGDAANLLYDDAYFDACRTETLLNHVADPQRVICEMTRVTRPGGRVAALEFDNGSTMVDHPDHRTTRTILQTFADSMAQGWIGRELPRLFRRARLTGVQVNPAVVLAPYDIFRALISDHVRRLCEDQTLTEQQAGKWWSELDRQAASGEFFAGVTLVLVTATRPG
jgi:ubiquinone/menaquinone biosynthesis C-methylase UbiE